jgi:hypothetical protein
MVFLNNTNAVINDQASGLHVSIAGGGTDVVQNFAADPSMVVDLIGGVGGYTSAAQALAALQPDLHGGAMLSFGSSGSIDFVGVAPSQLHAANFQIG